MRSEKPSRRPGTVHYDVLDEMVVYCPDTLQTASMNESARVIWELCDGTRTIDEICADLASLTGLTAEQLRNDVATAIDRLRDLDLLTSGSA